MEPEIKKLYLRKAADYCAQAEHCQWDVLQKLSEWGVDRETSDEILSELISLNFVDDERYACALARGKMRTRRWGRRKIHQALLERRISAPCINIALKSIDEQEYHQNLDHLIERKLQEHAQKTLWKKRASIFRYLLQKGYLQEEIQSGWQRVGNDDNNS